MTRARQHASPVPRRTSSSLGSRVAIACCGLACDASPEPFDATPELAELTLFGEHVQMGVGDGMQICGHSFDYIDSFVEHYVETSSDGAMNGPIVWYYVPAALVQRKDVCGADAGSCERAGVVYSSSPIHTHEAVHAIRTLQLGRTPGLPILEEGIAQLHFSVDVGWNEAFRPSDMAAHLDGSRPPSLYDPVAQLLSIIAADEGQASVEAFVDASEDVEEEDALAQLAIDVLGVDLGELDARYAETPTCSALARARLLVECAKDPLPWGTSAQGPEVARALDAIACDAPDVVGPLDDRLWVYDTVEIAAAGSYSLEVDAPDGQRTQLISCELGCDGDVDVSWDSGHQQATLELEVGRYVVRMGRRLGDEQRAQLRMVESAG